MKKAHRQRIDYMPGPAAIEALDAAGKLFPHFTSQQDLIDKLVITGLSALCHDHWRAPVLLGKDRNKWTCAAPQKVGNPGK